MNAPSLKSMSRADHEADTARSVRCAIGLCEPWPRAAWRVILGRILSHCNAPPQDSCARSLRTSARVIQRSIPLRAKRHYDDSHDDPLTQRLTQSHRACTGRIDRVGSRSRPIAVHAIAQYGEPKYPAGLQAFRLRQSRRAARRHAGARQSEPADELRQVQSVHAARQSGARALADVREPDDGQFRRSSDRVRPARRRYRGRARRHVDDVSHQPESALLEWRSGDGGGRQVLVRDAEEPAGRAAVLGVLRADRARGRRRSAHDPLRIQERDARDAAARGRHAGVFAQVGDEAGRHAHSVRSARVSEADRQRRRI